MKKISCICLIVSLLLMTVCLNPVHATEEALSGPVINGCHSLDAQVPFLGSRPLVSNARATVLYEIGSQTLMHAYNADEAMYPASFVKIMTGLIVAEQGIMTEAVTATREVLDTVPLGAASTGLEPDEVVTVQDLLYCMLVGSANDAAAVLAHHISGSQSAFVAEMNRYAAELGCTGTNFTNPHGLHDPEQVTTARDAARILEAAYKNEIFAEAYGTVYYSVPATNKSGVRNLISGNYLLNGKEGPEIYYDARVVGSRTGTTEDDERCVASVAKTDDLELICIVMGSQSEYTENAGEVVVFGGYTETSQLIDNCEGFAARQILYGGQALRQYSVVNGNADVVVGPLESMSTVLPADITAESLTYRYQEDQNALQAPIEKGAKIASLEVWHNNSCVAQVDLFAMNSVPVQQLSGSETEQNNGNGLKIALYVVGIILGIVVAFVLVVRTVHWIRMIASRNRSRRYRRSRRRSR